jgi:hypothetical protein
LAASEPERLADLGCRQALVRQRRTIPQQLGTLRFGEPRRAQRLDALLAEPWRSRSMPGPIPRHAL